MQDEDVLVLKRMPIKEDSGEVVFGYVYPSKAVKTLIVDVETTGFNSMEDEVIEIGGSKVILDFETKKVYSIEPAFNFPSHDQCQ